MFSLPGGSLVSYFFFCEITCFHDLIFFLSFLFFQSSLNLSLHDVFSCHALFGFLITTGTCSHQLFNLLQPFFVPHTCHLACLRSFALVVVLAGWPRVLDRHRG